MEVKFVDGPFSPLHEQAIKDEIEGKYPVSNGLHDIGLNTGFNALYYARDLSNDWENPLNILEGGCGTGLALIELKLGIYAIHHYTSLEGKIHTTGVTLTPQHAEITNQRRVNPELQLDEMIVGPIELFPFENQYDMILDYFGAAFHFPREVLPVYGQVLKPTGISSVRLMIGDQYSGKPLSVWGIKELISENGLVISSEKINEKFVDFKLRSEKVENNTPI